jgi:hypothetical protein
LARLVIVCIQKHQPVERAAEIMTWARTQARMIWESFEAGEPIQDVATALYWLSVGSV